jgi:hypothetical protein
MFTATATATAPAVVLGFPRKSVPADTLAAIATLEATLSPAEFAEFVSEFTRPDGVWVPMSAFVEAVTEFAAGIVEGLEFVENEDGSAHAIPAAPAPAVAPARRGKPARKSRPLVLVDTDTVTVTKGGKVRRFSQSSRDARKVIEAGYRRIASEVVTEVRDLSEVVEGDEVAGFIE